MAKKMKIGVWGATGRMGQEIIGAAQKNPKMQICELSRKSKAIDLKRVDVVIDFSTEEGLNNILEMCLKQKTPLVSGVTGLSETTVTKIKKTSQHIPVLHASNMSVGVALLRQALAALGSAQGFDFAIEEIHHGHKKDNPSGTAKTLKSDIEKITGRKVHLPEGLRGGGVFGVHRVHILGERETLCFEHQALSRGIFAEGALRAAVWLINKKPGLYDMQDVLK